MKANNRMALTRAGIMMVFGFIFTVHAQSNLVSNSDFDLSVTGWTLTDGASWPYSGNGGNAIALVNETPSSSTDPTASQTINSLTPGNIYVVSGDYRRDKDRGGGSPEDFSFGVALDGVLIFQSVLPFDNQWHSFSFLHTPASSSEILSLSSQINGTGVEYRIDNISMREVPEPSAALLFLLGGSTVVWLHRKHGLNR